ncbi:MAG TPA: GvpL/GvpF family gas vesicle protein [Thermoanaerobaculia bacterium]|nr:GvpL/GvpF family gas vesicle protein [Thermoanaerobaculia bacterium]
MSALYLYALVGVPPAGDLGTGVAGEPLAVVRCGGLLAVAGEVAVRPPVTAETLVRHDVAVRRLAALVPALLPARFGEWLPDVSALAAALLPHAAEIVRALTLVEGCVQMTLRVFGAPEVPVVETPEAPETPGPGARYLAARRRAAAAGLPEVAALRQALQPLLRAERVERHAGGNLLATAHDLVGRGEAADYLRIVEAAVAQGEGLAGRKVTVSGPWPPYAFAPGGLG